MYDVVNEDEERGDSIDKIMIDPDDNTIDEESEGEQDVVDFQISCLQIGGRRQKRIDL